MTGLSACLGRSTYDELAEQMESRKGCHDDVWEVDDKVSIFYYTGDNYLQINESLREYSTNALVTKDTKIKSVADFISSALSKTKDHSYDLVFRWENDVHLDIRSVEVGNIIRYASFVSTSVDPKFTFYNSKPRKLTIKEPLGAYIADYSKCNIESELLIDKGAFFIIEHIDVKSNSIALRQLDSSELLQIKTNLINGEVA
ncbi:ADP-ribosyltransferase [Pectobacterium carotovorum]|uniref:ADP-ribosyltransferase n=1 Tax=Pectobacterium carotovorum TaxID=554 RepID=UPI0038734B5B